MKRKVLSGILGIMCMFMTGSVYAFTVSGNVSSSTGDAIFNAVISVNGQQDIPVNFDGSFSIDLSQPSTLSISAPDYVSQSYSVSGDCYLDVILESSGSLNIVTLKTTLLNGQLQITGQVHSTSGDPIFAYISVSGDSQTYNTNFDGSFTIYASRNSEVTFSAAGYISQKRKVTTSESWDIEMQDDL